MRITKSWIRDGLQKFGLLPGGHFGFDIPNGRLWAGFGNRNVEVITASSPQLATKADKLPSAAGNLLIADIDGNLADGGVTPDSVGGGVLASHKSSTYRFNESGTGTVAMPNSINDVVPAYFQAGDYDGFSDQKFYFEAGKVYRINLTTRRATSNSSPTAITVVDDLGNIECFVVTYSMISSSGNSASPSGIKTIKPDRDGYWELTWATSSTGLSLSSDYSYFQVEEITYTSTSAAEAGGGVLASHKVSTYTFNESGTGIANLPGAAGDIVPMWFQSGNYEGFSNNKFYFEAGKVYLLIAANRRYTSNSSPSQIKVADDLGNNVFSLYHPSGSSGCCPQNEKILKPDRNGYWELIWVLHSTGVALYSEESYFQVEEITYTSAPAAASGDGVYADRKVSRYHLNDTATGTVILTATPAGPLTMYHISGDYAGFADNKFYYEAGKEYRVTLSSRRDGSNSFIGEFGLKNEAGERVLYTTSFPVNYSGYYEGHSFDSRVIKPDSDGYWEVHLVSAGGPTVQSESTFFEIEEITYDAAPSASGGVDFSESEQSLGIAWLDGRGLYQQTFTDTIPDPSADTTITTSKSGIELAMIKSLLIVGADGKSYGGEYSQSTINAECESDGSEVKLTIPASDARFSGATAYVTLWFTKTIDDIGIYPIARWLFDGDTLDAIGSYHITSGGAVFSGSALDCSASGRQSVLLPEMGDYTIAARVYVPTGDLNAYFLGNTVDGQWFIHTSGALSLYVGGMGTVSAWAFPLDRFVTLIAVRSGTTMKFYDRDNIEVASFSVPSGTTNGYSTQGMNFNQRGSDTNAAWYFDGLIDRAEIYAQALDPVSLAAVLSTFPADGTAEVIAIAYLNGSSVFVYAMDGTNQNDITNQGDNGTSNDLLLYACRNIEILATQTPTVATLNSTEYIYTLDGTDGTLSEVQTSGTTYTVPAGTYAFILRSDSQISSAHQTAIEAAPLEMVKLALGETSTISGISTADIAMYVPGRETVGAIFDIVNPFTALTYSTATFFHAGDSQATMTPITGGARVEIAPGDEGTGVCTLILADTSGGSTSGDRIIPEFTVTINSGTLRIDQVLSCGAIYSDDITTDGTYRIFTDPGNGGSNITLKIENTAPLSVDLVMVSAEKANVIECANSADSQHTNADESTFGLPDCALVRDSFDIITAVDDEVLHWKGTGYGETQARTYTATVTIDLTPTTVSALDLLYTTGGSGTISVDGSGNVTASSGTVAVDTTTLQPGVRSVITVTGISLDESSTLFDGFDGQIYNYQEVA